MPEPNPTESEAERRSRLLEQPMDPPRIPFPFFLSQVLLAGLLELPLWLGFFLLLYRFDCKGAAQGLSALLGVHWEDPVLGAVFISFTTAFLLLPDLVERRYKNRTKPAEAELLISRFREPNAQSRFRFFRMWAVSLTTLFLFFSTYTGLGFSETGFYDRAALLALTGDYHPYSSVTSVRLVETEGLFSGPDYEITLSSGETLLVGEDFGISVTQFEDAALPLFREAGVTIESED